MTLTPSDVPKYTDLMPLTLEGLQALGGSASIDELNEWIVARLGLTEAQLDATYPKSGDPIFPSQAAWARSYLKAVGYTDTSSRGVWTITPEGRTATAADLAEVPRRVTQLLAKRKKAEPRRTEDAPGDGAGWKEELLTRLRALQPDAFERLCQRVLREKGFTKVAVTARGADGGIDGQGVLRVNLLSFQVIFQAKRWQGSVGASVIRDFRGAMIGRADKGLVITTARFTADASKEAVRDGAPAIDLVDGEDFCDILKEIGLGVRVRTVEEVTVAPNDFDDI